VNTLKRWRLTSSMFTHRLFDLQNVKMLWSPYKRFHIKVSVQLSTNSKIQRFDTARIRENVISEKLTLIWKFIRPLKIFGNTIFILTVTKISYRSMRFTNGNLMFDCTGWWSDTVLDRRISFSNYLILFLSLIFFRKWQKFFV
jgi:hypothetical protein